MNNQEYNGWTNYETWLVNLWMDNCEGAQQYWSEIAQESIDQHNDNCEPENWFYFEGVLKEFLEEIRDGREGLAGDLLGAAISEVDTRDIAKSWVSNQVEVQA